MTIETGRLFITYDGEIYNHADFRSELEAKGHLYLQVALRHGSRSSPLRRIWNASCRPLAWDVCVCDLGQSETRKWHNSNEIGAFFKSAALVFVPAGQAY